jgi:hypothetical protein
VPAIVPKGIVLAEREYGDLALRPLIDLVFLVRADRADGARRVLVERGYREERLRPVPALFRWSFPQLIFKKPGRPLDLAVVLQWSLVTWPRLHRLDLESVWAGARTCTIGGTGALVLAPLDLLLYLCVQADNHGYLNRAALGSEDPVELLFGTWTNNRLVRFVDLREAIRHAGDELDWDLFVARARASMLEDAVHASLTLTNDLLGPTVPRSVLTALRPSRPPPLRRWLLGAAAPATNGRPPPAPAQRVAAQGWQRLSARRHIRFAQLLGLAELAFPRPRALRGAPGRGEGLPLAARYPLHVGHTIGRSAVSFVSAASSRSEP